jgi:hypothetical protein
MRLIGFQERFCSHLVVYNILNLKERIILLIPEETRKVIFWLEGGRFHNIPVGSAKVC